MIDRPQTRPRPPIKPRDLKPGQRVLLEGKKYLVSDKTHEMSTAWENYPYTERLLVCIDDGSSRWIDDLFFDKEIRLDDEKANEIPTQSSSKHGGVGCEESTCGTDEASERASGWSPE